VLPDPGSYEERYRLAGDVGWTLFGTLVFAGLSSVWHTSEIYTVFALGAGTLAARAGGVFAAVRRAVAFRTDYAGITLGAVPGLLGSRGRAVFLPWADVEQIVLYQAPPGGRGRSARVQCIGIRRRPGALPLAWGNEQARGCPVPGVAAGATRRITAWRLDRDRLVAVTAAVAPGVTVVDAGGELGSGIGRPEVPGAGNGAEVA